MGFIRVVLLISAVTLLSFSRDAVKPYTVNTSRNSIKFHALDHLPSRSSSTTLFYFWFKANTINVTQGGYDGKLLHGAYTSFYLNNNIEEKGCFHYGLKDGVWKKWYDNGFLMEVINWRKGIRHGESQFFSPKGRLVSYATYKAGKLHGEVGSYEGDQLIRKQRYQNDKEVDKKDRSEHQKDSLEVKDPKTVKPKVRKEKPVETEKKSPTEKKGP